MQQLGLYLLGPFQATFDGTPIQGFTYDKVRALLAYLAVEARSPHNREALATLLWPEDPPEAARASLRKALSVLHQAIQNKVAAPPYLISQQDQVQFSIASHHWLDVAVFQSKLDAVDQHAHLQIDSCADCIQALEEAVSLYRGEFLQGLIVEDSIEFEDWVLVRREQFRARLLTALHELTLHFLYRGKYSRAQQYALRQVEIEPYREEAHRVLMRILAQSNQRSAALAQYETCRRLLNDELGVEPDHETQALYERIRSAGRAQPHHLPVLHQPIIGRGAELQSIDEHLANPDCRLLTLVGVGGAGKTSLALQAAQAHCGDFLHGVYWIPLTTLSYPEQMLMALMEALAITISNPSNPQAQLLDYLREKSILLVLDNFEHLLPQTQTSCSAGLNLLNEILQTAPDVKVLVTSRERLRLRAEWVVRVDGLAYPLKWTDVAPHALLDYAAIQLFIHRARQVMPGFTPSDEDYLAIARICQRLQGLPLAIELAAGWADQLKCQTMADQIDADLDFLVTSLRDTPDRHQSLRVVFQHSWNLLQAEEQMALRKLSVIRAGFNRRAARQVSGATPYQLAAFVHKSFLSQNAAEQYSTHPLLRQFLFEELAANPVEMENAQRAHAEYYAGYLQEREHALVVQHQIVHLDEVGADLPDCRAAWDWALAEKANPVLDQMLDGLYIYFWARNQFQEGHAMFEKAIAALRSCDPAAQNCLLLARLCSRFAEMISWVGDLHEAEKLAQESVAALRELDDQEELAFSLELLGRVYYWQGDYPRAKQALREAIHWAGASGIPHQLAQALNTLATVICEENAEYETAKNLYAESLALYEKAGNRIGIAKVLINQGAILYEEGDYKSARDLYQRSLEICRREGYPYGVSAALNNLSIVTRKLGDLENARKLVEESLSLKRETGNRIATLHSLLEYGTLNIEMGDYAASQQQFGEALQLALATQSKGLVFDAFVGLAELFSKQMRLVEAAQIVAWLLAQEDVGQEAKVQAKALLSELELLLPSGELAQCRKRAGERGLNQMVAEFSPPEGGCVR